MNIFRRCRRLVDRWIPRYSEITDNEASLVHRYYQFLCSIIVFFFVLFAANSARLGLYKLAAAQTVVIGIIFASVWAYRRTRSIVVAVNIIMACTAPVTFYRLYMLGGMESPILFGWPVISTLALMTLPFAWAMVWTVVHMAFAFYFYFAAAAGVDFPIIGTPAVVGNVRIAMICTVQIILFFSVYLIKRLNSDLRGQLRAETDEVTNVVRALSHDLSSPMMSLGYWIRNLEKKNLCPGLDKAQAIAILDECFKKIEMIKNREAEASGKKGSHSRAMLDPEEQLSKQVIRFTIVTLASVFACFSLYYLSIGAYKIGFLQAAVSLVSLCGWFVYKKTGSTAITGNLILMMGSTSGFFRAQYMGGISSAAFFVWPIIPVFVGALMPIPYAAFWVAVYIGMALYYDICARLGVIYPAMMSSEAASQVRMLLVCVVQVIVVTTIYYLKAQNKKYRSMIEDQKRTRLELLKVLTAEIGEPLKALHKKILSLQDASTAQVERSLQACLNVVEFTEGWVKSAESEGESTVDLREVIEEVSFLQESSLKSKGIELQVEVETGHFAPLVKAGRICLAYQILNNLVSNAIKFTPEGGKISIRVTGDQDHWDLSVVDSGIGIPDDILHKLFDPNKPTTRMGTGGEKGTGFGMPIVKMFVEKYDGIVQVKSKTVDQDPTNHGTAISVRLPKCQAVTLDSSQTRAS